MTRKSTEQLCKAMDDGIKAGSRIHPKHGPELKSRQFSMTNKKRNLAMNWQPTRLTKDAHNAALEILECKMQAQIAALQVKQDAMSEEQAAPLAELEKQLGTEHG